ncbi:MAG: AMP-binding protein [Firmicutes bacterium]|nr:AMP-binding protein [Bacillota bacterium]
MTITELLARNAAQYGQEICLTEINLELQDRDNVTWLEYELIENNPAGEYRREITWNVFDEKANRCANLLLKRGLKKGDKVALLLMNCLEWLPIYFGILKAGAIAVPLNFRYTAEEIKYCLELSESCALIFGPEFTGRLETIKEQIPGVKTIFYAGEDRPAFAESYDRLTANCASQAPAVSLESDDEAAIYFSSGTTGFPKAILHTHGSLMASAVTEQAHHAQTREDNFLCIPPLYHTGAKMHWFGSLLAGSKAVLLRGVKPDWILEAVSREKITIVWLLVPWAQDILDALDSGAVNREDYELSQWRLMHIGAQPVPPSLIRRWKKYFPTHLYDTNYGLTESSGPGCVHLGTENIHKVGAIGIPGHGWETKIVDPQGTVLDNGQVGELLVRGPGLMKCYYNDPEATRETIKDGWLHTGDMARVDEDGFIFLVDRKKDVIISGGENLYPVQIEDFLRSHAQIKDVAVIGLPDQRLGEIAAAIIELKAGSKCSAEDIKDFCAPLPRYKRPRAIIFDQVPRNPTGKIEKPLLREKYGVTNLVAAQTRNQNQ